MNCCGMCKFHEIGSAKTIIRTIRKDGQSVQVTIPVSQYGGHWGALNGKCISADSPRHNVVTGHQGHCAAFKRADNPFRVEPLKDAILDGQ